MIISLVLVSVWCWLTSMQVYRTLSERIEYGRPLDVYARRIRGRAIRCATAIFFALASIGCLTAAGWLVVSR